MTTKKLTLKQRYVLLHELLLEVQKKEYHYPNSDHMEYCRGCHRSPWWDPAHDDDCLVVKIDKVLKETQ